MRSSSLYDELFLIFGYVLILIDCTKIYPLTLLSINQSKGSPTFRGCQSEQHPNSIHMLILLCLDYHIPPLPFSISFCSPNHFLHTTKTAALIYRVFICGTLNSWLKIAGKSVLKFKLHLYQSCEFWSWTDHSHRGEIGVFLLPVSDSESVSNFGAVI